SGGGTVLLGRGGLLFCLILSYDRAAELRDVAASYPWILRRIADAFRPGAPLEPVGGNDHAWGGRKGSGDSAHRKSGHLLHHGTLLYGFDLPSIGSYLNSPERAPAYRAGRNHGEFVTNLPADAGKLKNLLAEAFTTEPGTLTPEILDRIPGLVTGKYM